MVFTTATFSSYSCRDFKDTDKKSQSQEVFCQCTSVLKHFEVFFSFLLSLDVSQLLCRVPVPKKMSKKRKLTDGSRKVVQPIPLDSSGRPVFPIVLGGLTVYSLGEVSVALPPSLSGSVGGESVFDLNCLNCLPSLRSSRTGCCSMTSAPSTQWVSAAPGCLPA